MDTTVAVTLTQPAKIAGKRRAPGWTGEVSAALAAELEKVGAIAPEGGDTARKKSAARAPARKGGKPVKS